MGAKRNGNARKRQSVQKAPARKTGSVASKVAQFQAAAEQENAGTSQPRTSYERGNTSATDMRANSELNEVEGATNSSTGTEYAETITEAHLQADPTLERSSETVTSLGALKDEPGDQYVSSSEREASVPASDIATNSFGTSSSEEPAVLEVQRPQVITIRTVPTGTSDDAFNFEAGQDRSLTPVSEVSSVAELKSAASPMSTAGAVSSGRPTIVQIGQKTPPIEEGRELPEFLEPEPAPGDEDEFDPDSYFGGSDDEVVFSSAGESNGAVVSVASPVMLQTSQFARGLHPKVSQIPGELVGDRGDKPRLVTVDTALAQAEKADSDHKLSALAEHSALLALTEPSELGMADAPARTSLLPSTQGVAAVPKTEIPSRNPRRAVRQDELNLETPAPIEPAASPPSADILDSYGSEGYKGAGLEVSHTAKEQTADGGEQSKEHDLEMTSQSPRPSSASSAPKHKPQSLWEEDAANQPINSTEIAGDAADGPRYESLGDVPHLSAPEREVDFANGSSGDISTPSPASPSSDTIVGVCVVGFHHARGPEVEYWVGPDGDQSNIWPYLPFQSLPDGSHSFEENLCYFTLLYDKVTHTAPNPTPKRSEAGELEEDPDYSNVETLFGISCTRQISAEKLLNKSDEVTRSTVQKSVVVIARKPIFGPIKEKLTVVTRSYFEQRNFDDRQVIDHLYENLVYMSAMPLTEHEFQVGTSVREVLHNFSSQTLVILKALLLETKILFFSNDTERLCSTQFAILSLIPDLADNLGDCGSPLLSRYERTLIKPTHLKTSDRRSLLRFMGLPLQVFAAGGFFSPFVPLQQIRELQAPETKFGMFGSTNQLFLTSGVKPDVLVNVDTLKVEVLNKELRPLLELTSADKAFINPLHTAVSSTWDSTNTWQPSSLAYHGSEDYIRHKFEDYIIGLLSSVKYDSYLAKLGPKPPQIFARDYATDPLKAFNVHWVTRWKTTNSYRIFQQFTDDEFFDVVEPVHIGAIKNRRRVDAVTDPRDHAREVALLGQSQPSEAAFSNFIGNIFRWSNKDHAPGVSRPVIITSDDQSRHSASSGRPTSDKSVVIADRSSRADRHSVVTSESPVIITSPESADTDHGPGPSSPTRPISMMAPKNLFFWKK